MGIDSFGSDSRDARFAPHPPTAAGLCRALRDRLRRIGGPTPPGETSLIAASVLATHDGKIAIVPGIAVAAAAAIAGDNRGFILGRRGGRWLLRRNGRWATTRRRHFEHGERFFARHGPKAVFFARWLPGLRVAGAWLAGAHDMRGAPSCSGTRSAGSRGPSPLASPPTSSNWHFTRTRSVSSERPSSRSIGALQHGPWHGAFMEPSGRNWWQPVANGTRSNRRERAGGLRISLPDAAVRRSPRRSCSRSTAPAPAHLTSRQGHARFSVWPW